MKTIYLIISVLLLMPCVSPALAHSDTATATETQNERPCCCRSIGHVIDRSQKSAKKTSTKDEKRPCCCSSVSNIIDIFHQGESTKADAKTAESENRPCCCMSIANVVDRANKSKQNSAAIAVKKSNKKVAYQVKKK